MGLAPAWADGFDFLFCEPLTERVSGVTGDFTPL
jgi:hypothetical protein